MTVKIPEFCLLVLIGPSGSGKSTLARRHFKPTEVLSSDFCRGLVADDENDQSSTSDAFDVLHTIAGKRLGAGRLTVIDATNVQDDARGPLVKLAREHDCLPVAVVLNMPEALCQERNRNRPDRSFGPHVVRNQVRDLRRSLRSLEGEGFRHVFVLGDPDEVENVIIERVPLWTNRRNETGPFDIIGDVHGCCDELEALLQRLGYSPSDGWAHPEGRKAVFVGDLVDRGPRSPDVLQLVMDSVEAGHAMCVPGNHDVKLLKKLRGRNVQITHGLAETLAQLEPHPEEFKQRVAGFIDGLVSHFVLDHGRLVVAHAGMKQAYQGRASGRVREFALFGETTGETDDFGLPIRYNWAAEYRGSARVVYGHTPVPEPEWLNRTINVDTGCVFGGRLTALRYPELELVSVPALKTYYAPARPFLPQGAAAPPLTAQQRHDELLDLSDVTGKRYIDTRLQRRILIREEQSAAALEVMSRFAADPRWLIYLPPTMAPPKTSHRPGMLESPEEAFDYFRQEGVPSVICEQKHMGSRAVVIVARSEEAATRRFGTVGQGAGICYTRTGRRFFDDDAMEQALLSRLQHALDTSGFWNSMETDWVCLDCELMPWSVKASSLLRSQYAPVAVAAEASLSRAVELSISPLLERLQSRLRDAHLFREAYRRYCWSVASMTDVRLAPFHVLATQGRSHVDKNHLWHMETIASLCAADPDWLLATPYRTVDLTDMASQDEAIAWWQELTARGGEGMVVKPLDFVAKGPRGLLQPALKCRGREYLRIIYGPEYTETENLERLRERGVGRKRSLAAREFALGVEGLERFARGEPLRHVHECVFGVLALESEPVDPRL